MGAKPMPAGAPEKFGSAVKETLDSAPDVKQTKAPAQQEAAKAEPAVEIDESDLESLETKKVPYSRFKEVNEKAKTVEQELAELRAQQAIQIQRATEDAELRIRARYEQAQQAKEVEEIADPYERQAIELKKELGNLQNELKNIRSESSRDRITGAIARLEERYPEADTEAVLAKAIYMKRTDPGSIEELMHTDHVKSVERAKRQVQSMIEEKKARARASVPLKEGGIRLKETERPKSINEANRLLKGLFKE